MLARFHLAWKNGAWKVIFLINSSLHVTITFKTSQQLQLSFSLNSTGTVSCIQSNPTVTSLIKGHFSRYVADYCNCCSSIQQQLSYIFTYMQSLSWFTWDKAADLKTSSVVLSPTETLPSPKLFLYYVSRTKHCLSLRVCTEPLHLLGNSTTQITPNNNAFVLQWAHFQYFNFKKPAITNTGTIHCESIQSTSQPVQACF